jgi:two-component system, sensor histidine kinase RegB
MSNHVEFTSTKLSPQRGALERFDMNLSWVLKLRWLAALTQLATIVFVHTLLQIELVWLPPLVIIGVTAVTNLILTVWFTQARREQLSRWKRAYTDWVLGSLMILDLLSLTGMLYSTGGPTNPFSIFYLVNLCLAAVVLHRGWAWCLNVFAIGCFILLIFWHIPLKHLSHPSFPSTDGIPPNISINQAGLIVAFATCSSVIVYFMTKLTHELRLQEQSLRVAQNRQAQSEKLEALGTFAAGAAHELSTPLSNIAIISKEMELELTKTATSETVREDLQVIQSEVKRCRAILDQMSIEAGQAIGESMASASIESLTVRAISDLPQHRQVQLHLHPSVQRQFVQLPVNAVAQTLRGLIKNALDASGHDLPVDVFVELTPDYLVWQIVDRGEGMSAEVLQRISEPFFTTKPPGKGTGLGIYLARSIVERLEGKIEFESEPDSGTTATVKLPSSFVHLAV